MTAPAPGLPQDVERALTEAITRAASIGYDGAPDDKYFGGEALDVALDRAMDSDKVTALRAAILAAMRAATAGSGEASAVAAASAAHVAPGGEPVAWGVFDGVRRLDTRRDTEAEARNTAAAWNGSGVEGAPFTVAPLFTRPAPPVSESFDAALAALDVEPVISLYDHVTQYDILGLDAVRAAHAEAVRVAVEAERAECEKACERFASRYFDASILHGSAEGTRINAAAAEAATNIAAAIRARGVAKPRTDGEAATRSGEGDKS